jgi:hypothetical protein
MSFHHRAMTPAEARLRLFRPGYYLLPLNGKNPGLPYQAYALGRGGGP